MTDDVKRRVERAVTATVWTKVDLPAFHRCPDALSARTYQRQTHRHLFRVTVIADAAQDIETHDLQDWVRDWWGQCPDFGAKSCQTIARDLGEDLLRFGVPAVCVSVGEDNENGASVYFEADQ